jgi:methionyl aminopeptidase
MGEILRTLYTKCVPGTSTLELDTIAEEMIRKAGGKPAFKGYRIPSIKTAFSGTICASVNTELVHGIPRKTTVLSEGDIVSVDIGKEWPDVKSKVKSQKSKAAMGMFTDTAITCAVGIIPEKTKELLRVTKQALEEGIKAAQPGNTVAAIGKAIESYVKSQGKYHIVQDLVGHGVGYKLHEDPHVPNFYDPGLESIMLVPGMVIAIEPMISMGDTFEVVTKPDGWTIEMADGALCAHFEHTVIITERGNIVATRRPGEEKEIFW